MCVVHRSGADGTLSCVLVLSPRAQVASVASITKLESCPSLAEEPWKPEFD